jgi:hypothetical protein
VTEEDPWVYGAAAARLLDKLDRLTVAVERLADNYAAVHKLRVTICPVCQQRADAKGQILHISGCAWGWPDSAVESPPFTAPE